MSKSRVTQIGSFIQKHQKSVVTMLLTIFLMAIPHLLLALTISVFLMSKF